MNAEKARPAQALARDRGPVHADPLNACRASPGRASHRPSPRRSFAAASGGAGSAHRRPCRSTSRRPRRASAVTDEGAAERRGPGPEATITATPGERDQAAEQLRARQEVRARYDREQRGDHRRRRDQQRRVAGRDVLERDRPQDLVDTEARARPAPGSPARRGRASRTIPRASAARSSSVSAAVPKRRNANVIGGICSLAALTTMKLAAHATMTSRTPVSATRRSRDGRWRQAGGGRARVRPDAETPAGGPAGVVPGSIGGGASIRRPRRARAPPRRPLR